MTMRVPFIPLASAGPVSVGIGPVWIIGVPLIGIIAIINKFAGAIGEYFRNFEHLNNTERLTPIVVIGVLVLLYAIIVGGTKLVLRGERLKEEAEARAEEERVAEEARLEAARQAQERAELAAAIKENGDGAVAIIMNTINAINYTSAEAPAEGPKRAEFLAIGDTINRVMNNVITFQKSYAHQDLVILQASFIELKDRIDAYLTPGYCRA
jgi:hypothetical protein